MLATDDGRRSRVELLDTQTGAQRGLVDFLSPDWTPTALVVVPGTSNDRLAIVATHADGRTVVEMRDARTGVLSNSFAALEPAETALAASLSPEIPGNAPGHELVILASNPQGEIVVETRDLGTGARVSRQAFLTASRSPRGLVIDGIESVGVAATDASGVLAVQMRNASTGALVADLEAPGSDPQPAPMPPPPSSGGGGGGGGLDATWMSVLFLLLLLGSLRRLSRHETNCEARPLALGPICHGLLKSLNCAGDGNPCSPAVSYRDDGHPAVIGERVRPELCGGSVLRHVQHAARTKRALPR